MSEHVLRELERRIILNEMIDFALETAFRDRPKMRLRKGQVHERIAELTRLPMSPYLRSVINRRLELKGYRMGLIKGFGFVFDIEEVPRA